MSSDSNAPIPCNLRSEADSERLLARVREYNRHKAKKSYAVNKERLDMTHMRVNTNGRTVDAHESLSIDEIVDIIQHSKDLMSRIHLSPTDIADTEVLLAHLGDGKTLVRTRGKDASKIYARLHTPVVCECGCKINRGLIYKHRQTKKHARLMADTA